jgi:hypothetical protein
MLIGPMRAFCLARHSRPPSALRRLAQWFICEHAEPYSRRGRCQKFVALEAPSNERQAGRLLLPFLLDLPGHGPTVRSAE